MNSHSARWKLTQQLRLRRNASALNIDLIFRFGHIGHKDEGDPSMLLNVVVAKQPAGGECSLDKVGGEMSHRWGRSPARQTKPRTLSFKLICRDRKGLSVVGR